MPKTKQKGPSVFCACAPAIRQIHWSDNYLGRRGCKLRFGDVDVETFVLPGCVSMKPYGTKARRKSGPAPRISSLHLICAQADALRNAKALAFEVGCSDLVEFGFPVVWTPEHALLYLPSGALDSNVDHVPECGPTLALSREDAIIKFTSFPSGSLHLQDVPKAVERSSGYDVVAIDWVF